jgi:predicted tellurium resistance membrane protein TerC
MLVVEALHYHVPKGYIYFSVFFSLVVEFINIKIRRKTIQKKKRFQEKTKAV